jgi:hypothetical protein
MHVYVCATIGLCSSVLRVEQSPYEPWVGKNIWLDMSMIGLDKVLDGIPLFSMMDVDVDMDMDVDVLKVTNTTTTTTNSLVALGASRS